MDLQQAHRLYDQGRWDQARAAYEAVLAQQNDAYAYARLGSLHRFHGSLIESRRCLENACTLEPENAAYCAAWGHVLLALGEIERGLSLLRQAVAQEPEHAEVLSSYLFAAHYDPQLDRDRLFQEHCRWGELQRRIVDRTQWAPPLIHAKEHLRIGYLSADFKQHSVGYTVGPLLREHDRDRFTVYGYTSVDQPDGMSAQIDNLFDVCHKVQHLDDAALARLIRQDGIDILLAVGGHSFGHRLSVLAYQPAPLQMDYGGIDTVGLPEVQFRLTDPWRDPPESQPYFLEALAYLPEGSTCYQPPAGCPAAGPLPAVTNGFVTFGACHGLQKINARTLSLWAKVLRAVPDSRLLIKCAAGEEPEIQESLHKKMCCRGIDPERIGVQGLWSGRLHLAFYQQVDIALDAFPFNAAVTALEGLWMGVPMLSLVGDQTVSRTGTSLMHQLDLAPLALKSEEQVIKMAQVLTRDLDSLAAIRATLRQRMMASSLGDIPRYVRGLEEQLRTLWNSAVAAHHRDPTL